ncbi:MAG TPA: uroporphyrinogen decarboxylase [Gammaproteobacteria bacterium]|nr:uroporphyrinogen decarboxylase [Gammaproteobacteria bacterium]
MPAIKNDRLLKALKREPVDRTPIWIMRQAGRYLPEYRTLRQRAGSFLELCKTPELACEVTLQPVERFALDAAILFSDILTIPEAMGLGLSFAEGEGPRFERPVRSRADIDRLGVPDPGSELGYVLDTVKLARAALDGRIPLIGFSGSPWTLAAYMVEGRSGTNFSRIKAMAFDTPADLHRLLDLLATSVTAYLSAQIGAGAQALMVFDTWGGILSEHCYREFSLAYMATIVAALKNVPGDADTPVILFTKGGGNWLEAIADTGCEAIGLDWTVDIGRARRRVGDRCALQGNMDPALLGARPESIRREVALLLQRYGRGSGHVFNLGHGITPEVDPEKVAALVDAVHELSQAYHR